MDGDGATEVRNRSWKWSDQNAENVQCPLYNYNLQTFRLGGTMRGGRDRPLLDDDYESNQHLPFWYVLPDQPVIMRHIQFAVTSWSNSFASGLLLSGKMAKHLVGLRLQMYTALKQPLTCSRRRPSSCGRHGVPQPKIWGWSAQLTRL